MVDIPSLTFTTDSGIEVKRFYNKFIDPFGGNEYRDMHDMNLNRKELDEVSAMMRDKPKTYGDYLRYVQSNGGEQ